MPAEGCSPDGGRPRGLLKRAYGRFIKLRGCPREIARGFAVGIFVGFTPTLGAQMLIAVPLAALLKSNKLAAAAGVWITNPVTVPFIYGLTYLVGSQLTGLSGHPSIGFVPEITLVEIAAKAPHIFWTLGVGGIVVGLPMAVAGYYFSLAAVTRYRERIQQKIAAGKERLIHHHRIRGKKRR
ncbi:MAG: DUF2062 domain-containing protein [Desulfobacterales bacterium]|jgi:hypothetical protein|nr:DUF2062 domain-containing protein [Desulfobacteraceae bacterium]MDY0311524.1 DUF2062 domain-containing protein [Desulfobacterales bacterium]